MKDNNRNIDLPTFEIVQNHGIKPPTMFKINEFTNVFQQIVDTYGIPNYKEANPAVFACVTFPFLFGIMFGDLGHGCVILSLGIFLCLASDLLKAKAPAMGPLLDLRYIILLMGLFAAYCGFIYNDFMSIPLFIFDSCYPVNPNDDGEIPVDEMVHNHTRPQMIQAPDCVYPIGVDPAWYLSYNELNFLNSLKMKLSVILGVMQMSLGVCMKAANSIHFKNHMDLFLEFIP